MESAGAAGGGRDDGTAVMKILLADDHILFREGLRYVLQSLADDVNIVEAGTFPEALRIGTENVGIDIALVDLRMPGMDGFEGLKALREAMPDTPIVVVSAIEGREQILKAIDCGAVGYIPKTMKSKVVISALRLVISGGIYLPPSLLATDAPPYVEPDDDDDIEPPAVHPVHMTPRQRDVLKLLAQGKSNKEIAKTLALSDGTVKLHVTALLKSLDVQNRTQAVIKAARLGLTSGNDDL